MYELNNIHPTVVIVGDVKMGIRNEIGPYTVLMGPLIIGDDNIIGPHVTIGMPGQDTRNPRYDSSNSPIKIGNNNIIREYTSIQKPCYKDLTLIGSNTYIMQSVHVPHDAVIADDVVITPMVVMGGIVQIMQGANLALSCSLHQYSVVGAYSIVGMGAVLSKNLKPFAKYVPRVPLSLNKYAVKKFGFEEHAKEIEDYVLSGIRPRATRLLEIIESYERAHIDSGRSEY